MKRVPLIALDDIYHLAVASLIGLLQQPAFASLRAPAARCAGFAAYHLSVAKRRRVEASLALWRPDGVGGSTGQRLVRAVFAATWRELFRASMPARAADAATDVRGLEHLRQALAAGRGAILWESGGFGERLAAKRILRASGMHVHQVHGPNSLGGFLLRGPASRFGQTVIRRLFDRWERRIVAELIYLSPSDSLSVVRKLAAVLRENGVLCVSADGRTGRRFVSVDLLGGPVVFATGAISLARLSRAPLLPMFCHRENGRTVLTIEPGLDVAGAGPRSDPSRVVRQYVRLLAAYVDRHPDQYRNWHLLHEAPDAADAGSGPRTSTTAGVERGA